MIVYILHTLSFSSNDLGIDMEITEAVQLHTIVTRIQKYTHNINSSTCPPCIPIIMKPMVLRYC